MDKDDKLNCYIIATASSLIQSLVAQLSTVKLSFKQDANKISRLSAKFADRTLKKFDEESMDVVDENTEILCNLIMKNIDAIEDKRIKEFNEYINNF